MTVVQPASEPGVHRSRRIWAAVVIVLAVGAGSAVVGRAVKNYINRTVAEAVASRLTVDRIEGRARTAALDVIKNSPSVVAESLNQYIVQQQQAAATKEEDGYRALLPEMADATGLPTSGPANAKLTVVYFFDANCPYCKQMESIVRPLITPNGDVRVIYREIPILGPASERAARFAAAVWKIDPQHFDQFHSALMNNKGHADDAVLGRIAIATLGEETAAKVVMAVGREDDALTAPIKRNLDLARKAGIKGTPFFSIGGKAFFKGAVSRDEFADAVNKALAGEP